ncbi:unnamed protein product [Prorocentrum cordatum]|uniref:Non-specific serine/threonine protein kinase n=1 Tax=Prorocentrum cordatum TaxID=2364126 RepID=A0ABN9QT88_9DINO|nr:unnamed protein product [Polarella glacialis]
MGGTPLSTYGTVADMVRAGSKKPNTILAEALFRLEAQLGHVALSARYHQLPRRIEDDYTLTSQVLGSGVSGSVICASRKGCQSGQLYAVKSFSLKQVATDKRKQVAAEAELFLCMDHPNVVRLYDVYESYDSLHLVMEQLDGGELFHRVKAQEAVSEREAAEVAWQVLLALNYIHSHGIVHGDVKLENILYDSKESKHLKLIDFGFSRRWDPSQRGVSGGACGTRSYVAPEVVLGRPCTSQSDMWSLGVVIFMLLARYRPFSNAAETVEGKFKVVPGRWKHVSKEGMHFIASLLTVGPGKRLTAEGALQHPWIARRHARGIHQVDPMTVEALRSFSHCPVFRRCCMQVAAWSLSEKECAPVEDIFLEMDAKHEGRITLSELRQELPEDQVDDAEVRQIFDALVADHDQEIHYSDFLAAMLDTRIKLTDDLLHYAFERFDVRHCGHISMSNVLEVLGEHFGGHRVLSLVQEAGLSKQGTLSFREFEAYMRGRGLPSARRPPGVRPCCALQ